MDALNGRGLWELIKHLKQWLTNLNRAGERRKQQSVDALRSVIVVSRSTATYLRQLRETGKPSHDTEARLSEQWTRLGFELRDLGLSKLAKRCDISGRFWSDASKLDADFIEKADIGLERMEQLARTMEAEIAR